LVVFPHKATCPAVVQVEPGVYCAKACAGIKTAHAKNMAKTMKEDFISPPKTVLTSYYNKFWFNDLLKLSVLTNFPHFSGL
jgi:hypothetical protein